VWFRRDLRDRDHAALAAALGNAGAVHCVFVFDTEILDHLEDRADPRVTFIRESVRELGEALAKRGGGLHVAHGRAREEIPKLARSLGVSAVYANRDYEPPAIDRDAEVAARLREAGIELTTFKDQVIFEASEVLTAAGAPYAVFTPYRNAWLKKLSPPALAPREGRRGRLAPTSSQMPSLAALGFTRRDPALSPGMSGAEAAWAAFRKRMASYAKERDFPALDAPSRLSVHLRFGTLSVRELVRTAHASRSAGAAAWLSELAWRDFFFAVLATRPDVVDHAYHHAFDAIEWEEDEAAFEAWRAGRTGYPLVDAAMRELAAQGTMHNRLRMVAASFLVKDLGIDWRKGARHFGAKLLDYDLASNNGNWQWCASTGCDAQPWFRIFNPVTQSRRFDAEGVHIRRWVPELARVPARAIHAPWEMGPAEQEACGCVIGRDYPAPIVSHEKARAATLERYEAVKAG
jgi:deoxyribodipyrimidine photo-lyase